jgi:hypothetical protein
MAARQPILFFNPHPTEGGWALPDQIPGPALPASIPVPREDTEPTHDEPAPAVTGDVPEGGLPWQTIQELRPFKGGNHKRLYRLSRAALRAEQAGLHIDRRAVFSQWWTLSEGQLKNEELGFDGHLGNFLGCFSSPLVSPLSGLFAKAQAEPLPQESAVATDPRVKTLVAFCRQLSLAAIETSGVFHLGARQVQGLFGLQSHFTASSWLSLLCAEGVLSRISKGSRKEHKNSEYRFIPGRCA